MHRDISRNVCIDCGHAISMHSDNGCIHREAGARETPPRTCTCERTAFELRMNPELHRATEETSPSGDVQRADGTNGDR